MQRSRHPHESTESPLERWSERHGPRLLAGVSLVTSVVILGRLAGLLADVGPSTELLGGIALGSGIALGLIRLTGGTMMPARHRTTERADIDTSLPTGPITAVDATGALPPASRGQTHVREASSDMITLDHTHPPSSNP